ncbi:MAG: hypothetical protein J6M34_05740 [Clostridia bacterium]|nr:hypothetical protein [Clostridia bacterium]
MKRVFAILLCLITVFSLVACGNDAVDTDTSAAGDGLFTEDLADSAVSSETSDVKPSTDTGADKTTSSDQPDDKAEVILYDPKMEHKFIATDIANHSIVVYDLNLCDGDYQLLKDDDVAVIWEWDADEDPNCKLKDQVASGIDAAKYRYSPYYKRDVIVACSSAGWAGVIDYEARTVLWEYNIGNGPHSIELMPNSGDVVVACSSGPKSGKLSYIPLSAGETKPSHYIFCPSGHGVMWDPQNEHLWVLEYEQVFACYVEGEGTKNARLKRVEGSGANFNKQDASGHAFSPVYGQPGKYWVTAGKLWQFDAETETLTRTFSRSGKYTANSIKGIAGFADGTSIQTVAEFSGKGKTTYDWSCDGFRIVVMEMSSGQVKQPTAKVYNVYFNTSHREFYKVHPFTKDYQ